MCFNMQWVNISTVKFLHLKVKKIYGFLSDEAFRALKCCSLSSLRHKMNVTQTHKTYLDCVHLFPCISIQVNILNKFNFPVESLWCLVAAVE